MLPDLSAAQLRRAADLQGQIEKAQKELARILSVPAAAPAPAKAFRPRRAASANPAPSGQPGKPSLASQVRATLAAAGSPLSIDEIMNVLAARGERLPTRAKFAVRLYNTAGIKRAAPGVFELRG